jgi:hypothetical protein
MSADVRSIAAVIDWRADFINYGDSLAEAMAGVDLEIRRAYDWLEEQLALWKRAVRACEDEVTRAKAELAQRNFQTWDGRQPDCTVQEKALRQAKARLEYAEEKVETVRRWIGRLPKMIDELFTGPSRRLKGMLEVDVPNATTELGRRVAALESYAGLRPDYAPAPSTLPPNPSPQPQPPGGEGEPALGGVAHARAGVPAPSSGGLTPPLPPGEGAGGRGSSSAPEEKP